MLLSLGATQAGYWIFLIAIPSILSFWKLDFRDDLDLSKTLNINNKLFKFNPSNNDLIIFNSSLNHSVIDKNPEDKDRISLA